MIETQCTVTPTTETTIILEVLVELDECIAESCVLVMDEGGIVHLALWNI